MNLLDFLYNESVEIVIILLILLLGFIIGKVIGKLLQVILHELNFNAILNKGVGARIPAESIISGLVSYIIYFITFIIVLQRIGITDVVLRVIIIIVVIVVILFLVSGFRDILSNLIARFIVQRKFILRVNNKIKIKNLEGKIIRIEMLDIVIETKNKDLIYIPYSLLLKKEVTKEFTKKNKKRIEL